MAQAGTQPAARWTFAFEEGRPEMLDLLGGKGAGLAEMSRIGLPVPPGFTITAEACRAYFRAERRLPDGLLEEVRRRLQALEIRSGKRFGDPFNPLLLAVRSGARVSMPGMLDSVLDLGCTPEVAEGLARAAGDARFGADCYRRFVQTFGSIVLGVDRDQFEQALAQLVRARGVGSDLELGADDLRGLAARYRDIVRESGQELPDDPLRQLEMAIRAVFESWNNPRAVTYRTRHGIPHDLGTAVNVQAMVFGNLGPDSATGVAFTRDPATGERVVYGEFLMGAQGEDVVAGLRTPDPLPRLERQLPQAYRELLKALDLLERRRRDVQDVEFTVERGKLHLLQARAGKRTTRAAVRIAVDMAGEGLISREEALLRVDAADFERVLLRQVDPAAARTAVARGLGASPGAAQGAVVLDASAAVDRSRRGEKVILVRMQTDPDDLHGMLAAQGILTARGGMTSHAAVVARGVGTPAVVGVEALRVDERSRQVAVGRVTVREGEVITIDGSSGAVMLGAVPLVEPASSAEVEAFLRWADEARTLRVRANADTAGDARRARELGAEGIGLCRTEGMLAAGERQPMLRELVAAASEKDRPAALERLLPLHRSDFEGLFREMAGLPVAVRLLDEWAEPRTGARGCRLAILHPEIYELQVRAILGAAIGLVRDEGLRVLPEILVPFVGHASELRLVREQVAAVADRLIRESGTRVEYAFGAMVEIPRAALVADEVAQLGGLLSFGTDALTQAVLGLGREDAEARFLRVYLDRGILPADPFRVLDRDGVGRLMEIGAGRGKGARPDLVLGACGEHAGDPASVELCHRLGLSHVSCAPARVPVARLAAAQARLREKLEPDADA